MKRLIKRYVLKAQVDRESDEVNEGKNSLFIKAHFHCVIMCLRNTGFGKFSDAFNFSAYWYSMYKNVLMDSVHLKNINGVVTL